ncbi:MAG TPA: PqqD family peptide modification chaperone [Desulfobacteraceae bacterium]|nr:PqqD family peptide modification chaperone [Desulfobacteraceae bacterium]HPJ68079.1 PqqD family peptide modification chaperone [Desulfobacteraceae bacterium]HPQ28634.1 PqqD family peptide modification chaperone [Desulfobacteraceae bacterium]
MNKFPKLSENIEINLVEDGYIIYQSEKEKVHYLNNTAVLILEACTGKNSIEKIESIVQEAFKLGETPKEEIDDCINRLFEEGLIE